jgi:hypothetical protein
VVVWVDPQEPAGNRKFRSAIEKHGLVIEAGIVHEYGSAIAAQRRETKPTVKVA